MLWLLVLVPLFILSLRLDFNFAAYEIKDLILYLKGFLLFSNCISYYSLNAIIVSVAIFHWFILCYSCFEKRKSILQLYSYMWVITFLIISFSPLVGQCDFGIRTPPLGLSVHFIYWIFCMSSLTLFHVELKSVTSLLVHVILYPSKDFPS